MFVFAFEGALLALTYNGDRFVLFTLLPRRKPRTSSVQPPFRSVSRRNTATFKDLNLTSGGYSDSHVSFDRWPGFPYVYTVTPLPYTLLSKPVYGFTLKKSPVYCDGIAKKRSIPKNAPLEFQNLPSEPPCGGMVPALPGGAQPFRAARFSSSRFALLCLRFSQRRGNRCRTRCTCTRSRAQR